MKLITLLAIELYKDEIISILKEASVQTFSYTKITGYRDNTLEALNSNWFGTEMNDSESVFFLAFVPESTVDKIFELTNSFNAAQTSTSHIHISSISVERTN